MRLLSAESLSTTASLASTVDTPTSSPPGYCYFTPSPPLSFPGVTWHECHCSSHTLLHYYARTKLSWRVFFLSIINLRISRIEMSLEILKFSVTQLFPRRGELDRNSEHFDEWTWQFSEMYCDCVVRRSLRVEVEVETRECHQQPPFPARLSQLSVLRCGVVWCGVVWSPRHYP